MEEAVVVCVDPRRGRRFCFDWGPVAAAITLVGSLIGYEERNEIDTGAYSYLFPRQQSIRPVLNPALREPAPLVSLASDSFPMYNLVIVRLFDALHLTRRLAASRKRPDNLRLAESFSSRPSV